MSYKKTVAACASGLVLLLTVCPACAVANTNRADAVGERLTVAVSTLPSHFDPHESTYHTEAQIQTALYEGLFTTAPDTLEPQPALAAGYRVSRDKLRWTFTIRPNARWSDGSPITAEDIRNAWLDLLTHTGAPYSSLLDIVAGAQDYRTGRLPRESVALSAPDPTTLTVRLVEPAGHLPQLLCHGALAAVKPDRTLSSGPFVVTAHTREALTLKKNEHYWDTDAVGFTEILIQRIDDDDEAAFQFNTGNVEWLMEHSAPAAILNADAVHITAEFATLFLFFRANGGIWDNSAMRAALLEAAPWEKLRAGFLLPATTLLYPLPGYPAVAGYDYTDPAEAARRMEAARAEAGKTSREPLTLTFAIQAGAAYLEPILYALREAWEPLGVQVLPQVVYGDYFSAIDTIQADLFVYNWIGDFADPLAFLELFRGGSSLNQSGWHNDAYDALLSEASRLSTNERYTALARAEQILLDSAEIMPLSHLISVHVINTNIVGGWSANAINIHPFKYLFRKPDNQRMPGII